MSNLIYLNPLKVLAAVLILGSFSGNVVANPNTSQHLADLPNSLPPANLPMNPSTTVKVPPLNRPEAAQTPASPNSSVLPKNQLPTVQTIPAVRQIERSSPNFSVPMIIEFGQPLPQKPG